MLYTRLGVGIEILEANSFLDLTGQKTCVGPIVQRIAISASSYNDVVTGCTSILSGTYSKRTQTTVVPYGTFGLGVEANYDRYFGRIEGEYAVHAATKDVNFSDTWYYTVQMTAALGMRF